MPQGADVPDPDAIVRDALGRLLLPIARLCVGRGVAFADAEEQLKRAYVQAAREGRPRDGAAAARDVSRVSAATGINRREVTRISNQDEPREAPRGSPATQAFTRWMADPALRGRGGKPRSLPRQGPAPSFEALAQSITRDVHPRSLLEELCRLGLARVSADGETVTLLRTSFVPGDDPARLYGLLAANTGDHLAAAVANVLSGERRHFEQAIFSNDLSAESAAALRELVASHWTTLLAAMVPALEAMIEQDRAAGRSADHRIRVGLYSFQEALPGKDDDASK